MKILALDPGTTETGFVVLSGLDINSCNIVDNETMADRIAASHCDVLVTEWMKAMGMPQSDDVLRTVWWIGRFRERWGRGREYAEITRRQVKLHVCGHVRANDSNIRQALIDMYPPTGGGKTPQIGIKSQPGPLFGVRSHIWSALAVGVTYYENLVRSGEAGCDDDTRSHHRRPV